MQIFDQGTDIQITEKFVISLKTFNTDNLTQINNNTATFISLLNGSVESKNASMAGTLGACVNGDFSIKGTGYAVTCPGVKYNTDTFVNVDGNKHGELSYIDGCSNSIIVGAAKSGDPCLNYLYFPPGIAQTFHRHPSFRIGIIVSGTGVANIDDKTIPLSEGTVFFLPRYANHRFSTDNSHMSILVFHPDSEDGPTDEANPMKTRTYIQPW